MKTHGSIPCLVLLLALILSATTQAQVPPLLPIPDSLPADVKADLQNKRDALASRLAAFREQAKAYNEKYGNRDLPENDPFTQVGLVERARLDEVRKNYVRDAEVFNSLVQPLFDKGTPDSAPVDTRVKGPSRLDLPGGKDTLNPAINNANYRQGYDALRNSDPEAALRFFEQARKELPNDRMVQDALVMARGMVHRRQEEDNARKHLLGNAGSSGAGPTDEVKQFLFPDTPFVATPGKLFPDNPNPEMRLLNPTIEQRKITSLPAQGETAEAFAARFTQTDLYKKIDAMTSEQITPWNTDSIYPRGKYPEVDKVVYASITRINQLQKDGIRDACRKAAAEMNAEYAKLDKAGQLKPEDDLSKRAATDMDYANPRLIVYHRVYEQLGKDIGDVMLRNQIALDRLQQKIPELQNEAKPDIEKYLFPGDK